MLASQRELFDIPRDICYLNSASDSPLPLRTQEAARAAMGRKGAPWTLDAAFANRQHERARAAAARLINAEASDVALISSVSYGVGTVGKILAIPAGMRVLVSGKRPFLADPGMANASGRGPRLHHRDRAPARLMATGPRRCWPQSSGRTRNAPRAGLDLVGALVGRRPDRRCEKSCGAASGTAALFLIDATHARRRAPRWMSKASTRIS